MDRLSWFSTLKVATRVDLQHSTRSAAACTARQ